VDVGNNYSVLDNPNICFVYEYVGSKDSEREQSQFVSIVFRCCLHVWCVVSRFSCRSCMFFILLVLIIRIIVGKLRTKCF